MPAARISLILNISEQEVAKAAAELQQYYLKSGHALQVVSLGEKLQLCSLPEYAEIITRILEQRRPPMLSPAALETLAIIAYYQPITSAKISQIRGVDSTYTISSLSDKNLIEGKGRLEAPGRPTLYGTTDLFLRSMQISDLSQLPPLPEIASTEGIEKLQQAIEALQQPEVDRQMTVDDLTDSTGKEV